MTDCKKQYSPSQLIMEGLRDVERTILYMAADSESLFHDSLGKGDEMRMYGQCEGMDVCYSAIRDYIKSKEEE